MLKAAATGTPTTTRAAPLWRAQRTAATMVAPVANPSSMRRTALPSRSSGGRCDAEPRREPLPCQGDLDRAVQLIIGESVVRADVDAVPARGHTTESILRLARVDQLCAPRGRRVGVRVDVRPRPRRAPLRARGPRQPCHRHACAQVPQPAACRRQRDSGRGRSRLHCGRAGRAQGQCQSCQSRRGRPGAHDAGPRDAAWSR